MDIFYAVLALLGSGGLLIYTHERVEPYNHFPMYIAALIWILFIGFLAST